MDVFASSNCCAFYMTSMDLILLSSHTIHQSPTGTSKYRRHKQKKGAVVPSCERAQHGVSRKSHFSILSVRESFPFHWVCVQKAHCSGAFMILLHPPHFILLPKKKKRKKKGSFSCQVCVQLILSLSNWWIMSFPSIEVLEICLMCYYWVWLNCKFWLIHEFSLWNRWRLS